MTSLTLYDQLRQYRRQIAEQRDLAIFMVFSNKSLEDLVAKLPQNAEELAKVNGFAAKKIETYGADVLRIINSYREANPDLAAAESTAYQNKQQTAQEEKEASDGSNLYNIFRGALFSFNTYSKDDAPITLKYDTAQEYADICALYRLNDIVTEGTTYNKCVSLIAYLSAHLSHNPAYDNHIKTGLADLLEFAWDGEKKESLNSVCLAYILRSFFLSQNITARMVYMFPFSPYDSDSHVVTEAWLEEQQKWVMFDPTYNCCIPDENGILLSVAELREALSRREKLFLSAGASYNQKSLTTKEEENLAAFYAKNCFFFKINERQTLSGAANGQTVLIIPDGFDYDKYMLVKNRHTRRELRKPLSFMFTK